MSFYPLRLNKRRAGRASFSQSNLSRLEGSLHLPLLLWLLCELSVFLELLTFLLPGVATTWYHYIDPYSLLPLLVLPIQLTPQDVSYALQVFCG